MPKLPKLIVSLLTLAIFGYGYWAYQSAPGQAEWLFKTLYLLLWLPMIYVAFSSYLVWPSHRQEHQGTVQAQILVASLTFGGVIALLPLMLLDQSLLVNIVSAGLGSLVAIGAYTILRARAVRFAGNIEEG